MNVFENEKNQEQLNKLIDHQIKMKQIFDKMNRVSIEPKLHQSSKLYAEVKKYISIKLNKYSGKVEDLSKVFQNKQNKNLIQNDKFGFFKNESELNYEQDLMRQRNQLKLEDEVKQMELNDLQKLTESIAEVKQMFSKMNDMVIEQGTIVDRIDSHISSTVEIVDKGNMKLVKAIEHQTNGLADKVIKMLGMIVIGMTILLFMKYYWDLLEPTLTNFNFRYCQN